jgi:Protein of unknown function (DUF3078)
MKKLLVSLLFAGSVLAAMAQDATVKDLQNAASKSIAKDPKDTAQLAWKKGGQFNLNGGINTLDNWAAGGDEFAMNVNAFVNLYAFYKKDRNAWDNNLDMAYGLVNTSSLSTRKSADLVDFYSKYGYQLSKKWYAGALFNLRSQFTKGYTYDNTGAKTKVSNFFAPAYILTSLGLDYKPTGYFSVFISPITSRWVVVTDDSLVTKYGIATGKNVRNEIGAFLSANFNKEISKGVNFKSKLDLFSNYKKNPQNVDLFWTNLLSTKIARIIDLSVGLDLIYDDDIRVFGPLKTAPGLQRRFFVGFGYVKKFSNSKSK